MLIDYSYANEAFVDGLQYFLDGTAPNPFYIPSKTALKVRKPPTMQTFEKYCIQRWIVSELIDSIRDNPDKPVEETTYELTLKMLQFAQNAVDMKTFVVFSTAADFLDKSVINVFRERGEVYP